MRTLDDLIKPSVRRLAAYTLTPHRVPIKLNQNENPFGVPSAIVTETLRRIAGRDWARYPDFVPTDLQAVLAHFAGWRPDGVVVGNGSNEIIQALLTILVSPGVAVILSEPTFTVYRLMVEVLGGTVVNVPPRADFSYDVPAMLDAARRTQAAAMILCSPNNPTGVTVAEPELRAVLSGFDGLVMLDEAYHEFCNQNFVPLLADFPRLVVLRTFSKAMAMAGVRIGYGLVAPELAAELTKAKLPYNVNFFSLVAAQVAVELYDTELRPLVEQILQERERLTAAMSDVTWVRLLPSHANFHLLHTPQVTPHRLFEALLGRGILIRDVSRYPLLGEYVRFNIGTPDENNALLDFFASTHPDDFDERRRGE
ncbi:histidinol-phosphate transaminase [Chloracidobacterium validum]|uniref:Histidinol-phosphate aminotransferase n=1 Tax=Chloracidobacterium validum TaxID=2821543 RepID=A0ABX8B5Q7_9BACT|nr:histidinol-phosphate transaminase [Chloracidobacterium validum]QUW01984.1 histidinol-phosphate transaminase [Chloracidobacterium validum]